MKHRWFWGIFFIFSAIFLILNQLGIGIVLPQIGFWTILLTVIIVAFGIKSLMYRSYTGFIFMVAFLFIIYAKYFGLERISSWSVLGAAVLLSIGVSFIFPHGYRKTGTNNRGIQNDDATVVNIGSRYANDIRYLDSENLQNVNLSTSMSGVSLYFNQRITSNPVLNVDASMSSVKVYVSRDWNVIVDVDRFMSGISREDIFFDGEFNHQLTIKGNMSLSGLEIIYS